jgi:predicted phosphodiesterase
VTKVQLFSDLHFEFHADLGKSFVEALDPTGVDVLIIAGDLASSECLEYALELFCARFPQIVYVTGNHEFYGASPAATRSTWLASAKRHKNLHWLDDDAVTIAGTRFVGSTLWFGRPSNPKLREGLSDYFAIADFEPWVYEKNSAAKKYLANNVHEGDVVVTHHLPSYMSVTPQYAGHPLNPFFVCDVESTILDNRPKLWVHGHSHEPVDYVLSQTRVLSNPHGFPRETRPKFQYKLVVEV